MRMMRSEEGLVKKPRENRAGLWGWKKGTILKWRRVDGNEGAGHLSSQNEIINIRHIIPNPVHNVIPLSPCVVNLAK